MVCMVSSLVCNCELLHKQHFALFRDPSEHLDLAVQSGNYLPQADLSRAMPSTLPTSALVSQNRQLVHHNRWRRHASAIISANLLCRLARGWVGAAVSGKQGLPAL